jgi:serpin B
VAHELAPAVTAADYQSFVAETNQFGLDLLLGLALSEGNLFLSPVSVAYCLGMMVAGARGTTAEQIKQVLRTSLPDPALHAAFNQLGIDIAARNVAPHLTPGNNLLSVDIRLADSLWVQDGFAIEPDYLNTLSQNYDSGVWLTDFAQNPEGSRQSINQWVSDATVQKIANLLGPGSVVPETRVVLVNALYLAANWSIMAFDVALTSPGVFHTLAGEDVDASMMHRTEYYNYAAGDNWEMVTLPYDGRQLSMALLLPAAGQFTAVRDGLSSAWLEQARSALASREIRLTLPKFRFTWGSKPLTPVLQSLGMTDAFDASQADFSGISSANPVPTGGMVHQAFVGVDEKGTEAAAATAWPTTGMDIGPVDFVLDRPFLFFIQDETGVVLFVGQLVDPSG